MKVWNYIFIFTGMMLFLTFLGINNGFSNTLNFIGFNIGNVTTATSQSLASNSFNLQNSELWTKIFGIGGFLVLVLAGGGVIVGLFGKSVSPELITLPIIAYVFTAFVNTGRILIQTTQSLGQVWLTAIMITIFVPLMVGFVVALVEWFRGVYD